MKKWSYEICLATMIAFCLPFTSAMGQGECFDPCGRDNCGCEDYSIGVSFLWWKTCVDHLDFGYCVDLSSAFQNQSFTRVKYKTVCPDWEPGIRIQGMASNLCSGLGLSASWTHISPKKTGNIKGTSLFFGGSPGASEENGASLSFRQRLQALGSGNDDFKLCYSSSSLLGILLPFDRLRSTWDVCYHDWDVLLFYPCCICNNQVWTPYFGFASLILNQEVKEFGKGIIGVKNIFAFVHDYKAKWKSDLNAYGLRVGMKYEWDFCSCLKIFGKADASIVAGNPCNELKRKHFFDLKIGESLGVPPTEEEAAVSSGLSQFLSKEGFNSNGIFKDDGCYRCYPGYRLAAGVTYETCMCNTDLWLSVGYEFVEWRNLPNRRMPLETVNPGLGLAFDFDDLTAQQLLNEIEINPVASLSFPSFNTTSPSDRTLGFHGLFVEVGASF
ncbi:MAG: Lpg1974 family pore-forming outer membrane protein [Waddliaceae bacterium]